MRDEIVSVDLGGTRMRVAVVSSLGEVRQRAVRQTPRDATCPEALLALIGEVGGGPSLDSAVIGVPGRVHYGSGRLEHAPNLPPTWIDSLSEPFLSDVLGLRVTLANDADLATVGEHRFGAGRRYGDMVYVTFSTGVGAGVVLDGRLVHGLRSIAEAGHTIIDRVAEFHGQPSTFEQQASGTALGRGAADEGLEARGRELMDLVRAGDATAARAWGTVAEAAGIGVANLAQLFSPEVVVVGGGLGLTGMLTEPIRSALDRHGPRGLPRPIEVSVAMLGDDAGLVGAAGWASAFALEADPGETWEVVT